MLVRMPRWLSCHAILGYPGKFYRAFEAIPDGITLPGVCKRYMITQEEARLGREREEQRQAAQPPPEPLAQARRSRRKRAVRQAS